MEEVEREPRSLMREWLLMLMTGKVRIPGQRRSSTPGDSHKKTAIPTRVSHKKMKLHPGTLAEKLKLAPGTP